MSALTDLLDERVSVARIKAGKAATEARAASGSTTAQAEADEALADLDHYVKLRHRLTDEMPTGPYDGKGYSFFGDVVASAEMQDRAAQRRLTVDKETRSTMSAYGGLVVPAFLENQLANSGHSARPLCDLIAEVLPEAGATVTLPQVTTAMTAESQDGENTAVTPDDPATTGREFPINTVSSAATVSHASVARARGTGFDTFVAREILGSADALQEARVINGTGSNGQPTGILTAAGVTTYELTGTTAYDMLDAIGRTSAAVDLARGNPADLVVLSPRRWRWLLANSGDRSSAITPSGTPGPVIGKLLGIDVVASPSIPVALGTSTDEDRIIITRRSDIYIGEAPATVELQKDHSGAGTLTSKIVCHRYYASGVVATSAVQVIVGAGTKNPYT